MTAEPDLLPLPEMDIYALGSGVGLRDVRHTPVGFSQKKMSEYARACVAHATAAKDAEIEALRAEVERLTFEMERLQQQYDERTACMIVHRGSALACSDAVRAAYSEEHERAERLAEALREMLLNAPGGHSCEEFHHHKSDRHMPGDDCPAQLRWVKAVSTAQAALLRDQEGKSND